MNDCVYVGEGFSMVLLDVEMPELNGIDACKMIREFNTWIPIVALTGDIFENDYYNHYLPSSFL